MRNVFLIARRELSTHVTTLRGWIIIGLALFLVALLFNVYAVPGVAKKSGLVLTDFFFGTSGLTMVAAVVISMRLISEERTGGTLPLLYSSPVRDLEIICGKYLGAMGFMVLFLASTLFMPVLVLAYGKVSFGHIFVGYLGLLLVASVSVGAGILASAMSPNQLVSVIVGLVLIIALTIVWWLAHVTDAPMSDVFTELAWYGHFRPFSEGIVHLRHAMYFALFTYFSLFASTRVLEARRWR